MSIKNFRVAIIGGGPTGSALALMLARACKMPEQIALIQADALTNYGFDPNKDPRVLAINHGSKVLLESLDAWSTQSVAIEHIHVSQKGYFGRTVIDRDDFNVAQLGCVVAYAGLHAALSEAVQASGVEILRGQAGQVLAHDANGADISVGADTIRAQVVIQADGIAQADKTRDYTQAAIIAYARASHPKKGWAFERFTNEGPLAVLPHPLAPDQQAVVWCCSPERAYALKQMSCGDFSTALTDMFGARLGFLRVEAPVSVFPLTLNVKQKLVDGRCAVIGNAAQTMHPVAGQGLNLGLRDAAVLARHLTAWLCEATTSPDGGLKQFEQDRLIDRNLTVRMTDTMSRFFATKNPLPHHIAGLGLFALDTLPALRMPLARHLLQGLRL